MSGTRESNEEQVFEGVYVRHWEVARFAVVRGRRVFGLLPRVEKWKPVFPESLATQLPPIGRSAPRFYRMRVLGRLGPKGAFGHKGICSHELFVSEVLSCDEIDELEPTW